MATDQAIEQEIQAKGLKAPRITPASIEAAIEAEYYFSAAAAVSDSAFENPVRVEHLDQLRLLTICVLVMRNGFTVIGKSACASPENFDHELGKRISRADAVNQIWPLEGYLLKDHLYSEGIAARAFNGGTPT